MSNLSTNKRSRNRARKRSEMCRWTHRARSYGRISKWATWFKSRKNPESITSSTLRQRMEVRRVRIRRKAMVGLSRIVGRWSRRHNFSHSRFAKSSRKSSRNSTSSWITCSTCTSFRSVSRPFGSWSSARMASIWPQGGWTESYASTKLCQYTTVSGKLQLYSIQPVCIRGLSHAKSSKTATNLTSSISTGAQKSHTKTTSSQQAPTWKSSSGT